MIRVQTYNTSPRRLQIGGIDAGAPRGGVGNVTGTATDNVWADILDAGKKLTGIAIQEYVKDETARVNESLLAMQKELTEERNRYMTENRGQNAIGAGQHFARFARTTAQKYLQEGKFSGRFAEMFERQAAGAALHYAEQGQNYGNQQRDIWQKSVWESSLSMAMDGASNDWGNDEYANFQRQSLYEQIDARFPGQDNRARKQEVDQSIARARMSGAIASQDFDGAEKLLGTLSGRNLSANNFGNVKNSKGGYNAYATRQDGLMGVGERVLRYSNAPDRGWHAQTIREMVDIYAPASDNNNPAEYARFLADRIGVAPNEQVDFRDPKILAGLIKNMPVMEHGNGVRISDEEAMAAAQSLLAGNKPKIVGQAPGKGEPALSATDRIAYRRQIDAARTRQEENMVRDQVGGWLDAVKDLPEEEQVAAIYKNLDTIQDPRKRSTMERLAVDQLTFNRKVRESQMALAASTFSDRVQQENLSPLEAQKVLQETVPEEARGLAWDRAFGKLTENTANRAALDDVLTRIDTGEITNKQQIETAGFNARMTNEQIKKAATYLEKGGNTQGASISKVKAIYKELEGKNELPEGLYDAVLAILPPGKVPTEKELRSIVANALMDGDLTKRDEDGRIVRDGWFSGASYYEALSEGRASDWRVSVSAQESSEIHDALRNLGLSEKEITFDKIRAYKQHIMLGMPQQQTRQVSANTTRAGER